MERFSIPAKDFDLELTMTCGQTFCWRRVDGDLYGKGSARFYTFRKGEPVIVEQKEQRLFAETELSSSEVEKALGLDHDLEEIFSTFPQEDHLEKARQEYWGLRIVQDEFLPCLVSYLCSPQMRIPRIKEMHDSIARRYGEIIEVAGRQLLKFPSQRQLAEVTEEELRDLGIGYRSEYIVETIEMLEDFDPQKVRNMEYLDAREEMKKLHGVGDKVADCVLLFSLGFHEAAPLDTWAEKAVKTYHPELHSDSYAETSENLHSHYGEKAGYAQEYMFHAARQGVLEV